MKEKGFTLIELLAVIVILAIIALIAVPIVLNIINNTKESSVIRSTELYLEAVDQMIAREQLNNNIIENGKYSVQELTKVEVKGESPTDGMIEIAEGKITDYSLLIGEHIVNYDKSLKKPVIGGELRRVKVIVDLMEGLTPVQYVNNNWKVVDGTKKNWYNYSNQEWANAVILNDNITKDIGDTVNVASEVKAMFVYVPRYEYKIDGTYGKDGTSAVSPGEIEVNFINKDATASSGYRIHPAFTFGNEELNGIWVGKFETSHTTLSSSTTENNLGCSSETCTNADGLRILPNVTSLRYNSVSNMFYSARSMARNGNGFGLSSSNVDSHMMKNSEWGAVAYLSQSKYGKYGNTMYTGTNKEIYQNKDSGFITGKSNGTPSQLATNTQCAYDDITNRGSGLGSCGGGASTTGNITGIYDMSGGACEYVMGNLNNTISKDGFIALPDSKYYDVYTTTELTKACSGGICYGHALSETSGWYGDYAKLGGAWILRSGIYSGSPSAGVFTLDNHVGIAFSNYSFRVVFSKVTS